MPSRSPERRTLLASVESWKASKGQPGPKGDLEAWAYATLGIKLARGPSLRDLGANGDIWADLLSAREELVRVKLAAAAERSPEWWAARLLLAVLEGEARMGASLSPVETIRGEMRAQLVKDRLEPEAAVGRDVVAGRRKGGREAAVARAENLGRANWKARALKLDKDMDGEKKERAAAIAERLGLSFRTVYDVLPGRRKSALSRKSSRSR